MGFPVPMIGEINKGDKKTFRIFGVVYSLPLIVGWKIGNTVPWDGGIDRDINVFDTV